MKHPGYIFCAWLLFCVSCGRKQRTIFQFPEKEPVKVNRIAIPATRGVRVIKQEHGILVTWYGLAQQESYNDLPANLIFLGYHVYRLANGYFVPKQPLTKKPVQSLSFFDKHATKVGKQYSYVVRGIFSIDNRIIMGPVSQIVGTVD